MNNLLW